MDLTIFSQQDFIQALKTFFENLEVPINYVADEPTSAKEILKDTYKDNDSFQFIDNVYFVGMVDDAAFEGNKSIEIEKIKSDYEGILIFGVMLKNRPNGLLPTRSQLAEISRAFNREFYYTPVVVVFKYENYLAFANTERLKYKQEWREGEKAGKVSLLRDVDFKEPHSGHIRILSELQIPTKGKNKVDSFAKLYANWQEVFSVSVLNKKFYQELSNWYFWAIKNVTFPSEPQINSFAKDGGNYQAKYTEKLNEHRATNVIRMLTRLLFVWFIKEKKLIPEELFELDSLQKDILKEISPYHENGMFKEGNKDSVYYKAILQNLFFATLNCPIEADSLDKRQRGFRGDGYGTHRGIDYLMRYKKYFKNPDAFLAKMNSVVPFLNGGLFECLDDKYNNIYIDGFSDQMTKGEQLIVPDYLFFGVEEETDLSDIIGIKDEKHKKSAVKGLINILKSYKFTITENTPIEEDVALDPELLGKVFENLLASYNPETKTTARKQTGSFYTPREIVNYMVDESLIAYLKNRISREASVFVELGKAQANLFGNEGVRGQQTLMADVNSPELKDDVEKLDSLLHELVSFNPGNPIEKYPNTSKHLLRYISECTILDPACGSGAFPMGILQKMVHILQKLDPDNETWYEVQLEKAQQESKDAFEIDDKQAREERLLEINEAFDQSINDPDYARKLFLIENCIYGVDIQPIATQISKLRFFISLVTDQKVNLEKENFGIRPLPNLETKFVAANTLIGIEKENNLFATDDIKNLERQLKATRSKLFSARTKDTKLKHRKTDKELRTQIAEKLKSQGLPLDSAEKLAKWDPYDQNVSSSFFDPEWMFDIREGFDVVIGNPPYGAEIKQEELNVISGFATKLFCKESAILFIEISHGLLSNSGSLTFIVPKALTYASNYKKTREFILNELLLTVDCGKAFEQVKLEAVVFLASKRCNDKSYNSVKFEDNSFKIISKIDKAETLSFGLLLNGISEIELNIAFLLKQKNMWLGNYISNVRGAGVQKNINQNHNGIPVIGGKEFDRFRIKGYRGYIESRIAEESLNGKLSDNSVLCQNIVAHILNPKEHIKITAYLPKTDDFWIMDTVNQLTIKKNTFSKYVLWAILNSKLVNWYVFRFIYGKAIRTMHFDSPVTDRIPLPSRLRDSPFEQLHNILIFYQNHVLSKILDSIVFNIYFPEHMKERGIDVLEFVEQDINEVMQGRDFEQLNDEEKEIVIEVLHKTWSNPENEVVKRMAMFKERSPEILKPILES